jgi:hypothetical protein
VERSRVSATPAPDETDPGKNFVEKLRARKSGLAEPLRDPELEPSIDTAAYV